MKKIYIVLAVIVVAVIASAYLVSQDRDSVSTDKKQVTASFFPIYFFAQAIGGEHAEVRNFTPSGVEPHDYEPTPRDIASLETSDLIILNGGGLEAWAENLPDVIRNEVEIVKVGDDLATLEGGEHEHGEEGHDHEEDHVRDPHVWLAPLLAKQEAAQISEAFIKIDPANRADYEANTAILNEKLDKLDQDFRDGLKGCKQKNIVTSHAAFSYLAEAYGLNQVAITGISPEDEPSQQDLARISDFAKRENIRYIFFESLVSPKLSETIAQEIGAQTLVLDPIESGTDYFRHMYDNLENLMIALECQT